MPIETNLNRSPYFDDYESSKNYYKELFQPGVSVQVRELNQLQSMFQAQIERMADNIFSRGTIIDGCNFVFYPVYPYIKIKDIETDGFAAATSRYLNFVLTNESNNLKAFVINHKEGFEATVPNLKTLYVKYLNSGNNSNTFAYTAGDILKVTNFALSVFKISVNNGGLGFSNSDNLIVTPAIVVNVSTGAFVNGEYITNDLGANLQIVDIDTTTLANSSQIILSLKPRAIDLANAIVNTSIWVVSNNDAIRNVSNTVAAVIENIIGSGLDGEIITNGVGKINEITITEEGQGFSKAPQVTVQSANNTSGLAVLNLAAQNYLAKITISGTANAVGNGYAFGVSEGIIYQKGYFIKVSPQTVIVEKYHQSPNALSIGFATHEEIVDSNIDPSILDNAFIEENENGPGADRLKLTPELKVISKSEADTNSEFFSIVEFSEGQPYKQKQFTQYNKIGDFIAQGLSDVAGDFVKDPFLFTSRSVLQTNQESEFISIVVDPGKAYIQGKEVATYRNFSTDIRTGTDTRTNNNQIVSLDYGAYVTCNNFAGVFQFNTGDQVKLYDTPKNLYANTSAVESGNTTPLGTQIGTANIRNVVRDPTLIFGWRIYLFNINMNQGQNFRAIRAIFYDGTNKGIADVMPVLDGTLGSNVAELVRPQDSKLLFYSGVKSLKNSSNNTYIYRTIDQTTATVNTGLLTKDISAITDEFFPYSGALTSIQLRDLMIIPSANLQQNSAVTGTADVNTTSPNVVGSSTAFLTDFQVGDYILETPNATSSAIRRVMSIVNNTLIVTNANSSFANTSTNIYRIFPKGIPVPFGYRSGLTANVNGNGNILTLDFGMRFIHTGSVNTALGVNIQRRNTTQTTKVANRSKFIKIATSNNAGGVNGPWCLGVPDGFRLRNVYAGDVNVNTSSNNVISSFYVDHNQTLDYMGLSFLYLKPKAKFQPNTSHYFLVEFDYFTTSGTGFYDAISYVSANSAQRFINDRLFLANLTSVISSWEIPEVWGNDGRYYDLMQQYDFRPYASNTVAPDSNASVAPLNPGSTISFGNTANSENEKKFPFPDSTFQAVVDEYVGRIDSIFVNKNGIIHVAEGKANTDLSRAQPPITPNSAMKISDVIIAPYPSLPLVKSSRLLELMNTNIANEKYRNKRQNDRVISRPRKKINNFVIEQPRGYTMQDIAKIDDRLKNVEYYVALNLLESDITNRIIPSSIDPALDRFKFGFFVDDYRNYKFLDKDNPQFAATVEDDDLVPEKMSWVIPFNNLSGPGEYIDFMVSNQENATTPIGAPTPPCIPTGEVGNNILLKTGIGLELYRFTANLTTIQSAPVTLFFQNFFNFNIMEIYQGNTIIKTGADAVALSNTDKTFVTGNSVSKWFKNVPSYLQAPVISGNSVKNAGKISWTHNPASGINYTFVINTDEDEAEWNTILEYPVNRLTIGCDTEENTVPVIFPDPCLGGDDDPEAGETGWGDSACGSDDDGDDGENNGD